MKFNINDIVITSNVENFYFYDKKNYLVLKIKEIKTDMWGIQYYKCNVLNDKNNFDSGHNYGFYEGEVQAPSEKQLLEISQNYWEEINNAISS